jgi:CBS-domain-containing membrane protein
MSLLQQGKAQMLTIYLGESDQWHGRSLYVTIVQMLREQGGAGATVTRAVAGYGAGTRLHTQEGLQWFSDAPVIITVVDQPARLQHVIPQLQEMMNGGLMTLQEVDVLKYTHARRQGISGSLPIRQIMETDVNIAHPDTPVSTVVDQLLMAPFRALPVVDADYHVVGILSTGDLIKAGLLPMRRGLVRTAQQLDQHTASVISSSLKSAHDTTRTVEQIMNRQVRTISPEQTIREAAQVLIETQKRNLPVIDAQGRLLGMVTRADLLSTIRTSPLMSASASNTTQPLEMMPSSKVPPQQEPITRYMNRAVATVEEETPFADVIDKLLTSPIKRVVVIDVQGHVKGIISDVDVLAGVEEQERQGFLAILSDWAHGKSSHMPTGALHTTTGKARVASDVMNRNIVTITATATVQETIERMMATHRKILPVVDQEERLVGIVGRFDVLRLLVESEVS